MNKEEIIIDGVDVRFCQYFNDKNKKCRTCSYVENIKYTSYKCEDDKNCYYKQYRRLKEQNEKLTETCESLLKIQYALADSCKKYIDCLEEIKAYCKSCEYGLQPQKIVNYIDEILESENQ